MNKKFLINVEEWHAVILSFIFYFCVLGSYYVMRPMRDQMAAQLGSGHLPMFFFATFVATLLLTPIFAWAVSKWSRRVVLPFVYLFFVACQLTFVFFFNHRGLISSQILGLTFFVWVSVFNLFVVSVFWSFMTDIWNDAQARRLFPIIALGGVFGAISGPLIARNLVEDLGLPLLLAVSAALLSVAILCLYFLGNWARQFRTHRNQAGNEAALGGGMLDGFKQIFVNPFIGQMAILMLLNDAISTIAYALITDYSGLTFYNDPIAQIKFAASLDLSANLIQIVLQLTLTRWLLVRYGAAGVFAVCAAVIVLACLILAVIKDPASPVLGTLPYLAWVMIMTRSLSFGMIQPARETLYTLVSRDLRYKGKNAVDTVVWRAGDVLSLLSIEGFRVLGVTVAGYGLIWAALAATSGAIGWRLASRTETGKTLD